MIAMYVVVLTFLQFLGVVVRERLVVQGIPSLWVIDAGGGAVSGLDEHTVVSAAGRDNKTAKLVKTCGGG